MAKPIRRVAYNAQTTAHINSWVSRMVEIEFGTHPTRYKEQMGALIADIRDYANSIGIDYSNLYEFTWDKAKSRLHPDIFKD